MMKYLSFFLLIMLAACTNNADQQTIERHENDDETVVEEPITETKQFATAFAGLFRSFSLSDTSFHAAKFEKQNEGGIAEAPRDTLNDAELATISPVLLYNADSSKAIDLISYNFVLNKKGDKLYASGAGPDMEVSLIDIKTKSKERLLFFGPSYAVADAQWIDAKNLVIAGGELVTEDQLKPIIWKISLDEKKVEHYNYPDTLTIEATKLLQARFPSIVFK